MSLIKYYVMKGANDMTGYIYIFTNPGFEQYVKIGYADDWKKRLRELSNKSSVPYAFRCYAVYEVNKRLEDKVLHNMIDQLNPDLRTVDNINGKQRKREFYEMTPEQAYNILKAISIITNTDKKLYKISETEEDKKELKRAKDDKQQRPPFKFSMIGMKTGDKIYYKKNKNVIAIVVDDSHVKYGDITYSISSLAKELEKSSYPVQGPIFFTDVNGKTLDTLRTEKGK